MSFMTLDWDFFAASLCHPAHGVAWLDGRADDAAHVLRRFLKHPRFNTRAQRRGIVARVHHDGIAFWQRHRPTLQTGHGFAPRNDGAPIFNRLGRSFKQKAGCKPALQAVLQIPLAHGNTALETRALVLVMAESKNGAVPFVFGNNAIEIALRPLRKGFGKQFCRPGTWCDN
ncbi:MAG: hypothetical protein KGR98_12100, partial [Verrucomicrobia bacterium]|nr:hypothetical protein [Verrucomicrobiota bacterium]